MSTVAAVTFDHKGEQLTLEEYIAAICEKGSTLRKGGGGMIYPEALLGFEIGKPINFRPYEKLGFIHPKNDEYYKLNGESTDPEFLKIYEGIRDSGQITDDLLVNIHYDKNKDKYHLVIVDGATRASVISYLKSENSDLFHRVGIKLFAGETAAVQGEMFQRNLPGRNRPLRELEIMNGLDRLQKSGWTDEELAKRMGMSLNTVKEYLNCAANLITEVREVVAQGKLTRQAIFEAAKLPEADQHKIVEDVSNGTAIKAVNIRRSREDLQVNVLKRLQRLQERELPDIMKGLKGKKKFSTLGAEYAAFKDALDTFAAACKAVLDPEPEGE